MTAIKVELELVDGTFTTRMLHAGETIDQFNRNVSRSSPFLRKMAADGQSVIRSMEKAQDAGQGFLSTLRDVSIVAIAVSVGFNKIINIQDTWVGAVVRTNAEFERLTHMLRSMSGAADPVKDAADQVKSLVDTAKDAPFSLDNLTASFTKLKATGTDPMNGSLQAILDGVSAFGGDGQSLERTVLGISQASGKGVIQMEELRQQIGESMPQAMALMAASMGVSMATLIDHISTGRMAAGASLDAFYGELDRSFGGSASRMMQTFTGQLARTRTELQEFAQIIGDINSETGDANQGGFFATVTDQLREFNEALASSGGQVFAKQLGQSLASIAQWLQAVAEKAVEFRHALYNAAELAAWVIGIRTAIAVLTSLKAGYSSVVAGLQILSAEFNKSSAAAALHQRALANSAVSIASIDRASRLQAALGLRALASAAMSVIPVAGILGIAIYEIADAFDVFGNRGREAIDTLREFGDIARDQIPNAQKDIDRRQAELNKEVAQMRRSARTGMYIGMPGEDRAARRAAALKADMEEAKVSERQAQIDKDRALLREAENKAVEEDARKASDFALRQLDRQTAAEQRAYQIRREEIQKEMDERIAVAKDGGKSIDALEKERAERLLENAKQLYIAQQEQLQKAVGDLWSQNGIGPMQLTSQLQLDELLKRLDAVREKQAGLRINGDLPDVGTASTTDKDVEKLQKLFGKTSDDVAGLEDKLNGANDELGEFLAKFARGAYGDKSNVQVKELAQSIADLMRRKAALEEMNEGAEDLQSDIESARLKLIEKRMELEEKARGEELTEGEKIRMKIEQGAYKGLGPNSPALAALQDSIKGLTMQGRVTDAVGTSMDKTFGQTTVGKVTTLNDVLSKTLGIVTGIGDGVNGVNFGQLFAGLPTVQGMGEAWKGFAGAASKVFGGANLMSGNMQQWGNPNAPGWKDNNITSITTDKGLQVQVHKAAADAFKGFLNELSATGYDIKSLGGYNLRNKRGRNSLSEHAFGNAIDINPGANPMNKDLITDMPKNISALAAKYGLSWGGDWSSIKDAMHFEWRGGKQASTAQPAVDLNKPFDINNPFESKSVVDTSAVYGEANVFLEKRNQLLEAARLATTALTEEESKLNDDTKAQVGVDKKAELVRMIDEAKESLDGLDKNYRAVSKLISAGKFGDKNPETEQNRELLRLARELDAAEKSRGDRKQAAGNIENSEVRIKEQELQLQRQINELKAKAKDPNMRLESSGLVSLREDMDKYLADVATVYDQDSDQYRAALEKKRQALAMFGQTELLQDVSTSNAKTRELQRGLMTEGQSRQAAMQQELAEVDAKMTYYRQQGQLDVAATEQFEAEKAAIRKKYAAQDPMSKQMAEWGDLQGNLAKTSTQWTDALADGLTGLVTGTGDLKSMMQSLQNVANQVISMFIKKAMSGLMGPKTPNASGAGGKASKAAGPAKAAKATVGAAHTGAMLGQGVSMTRLVNPAVFKNAKKYHSGANRIGGRRLLPGEIPIIAKKDEGIFTKEQMAAMGGQMGGAGNTSQQISVNAPVTVNASGGTPEQNADLAKQISSEIEGTMRGVVVDEVMRQMRPGNMLSPGKGR
ncbi:tape measure protein [Pararhizobium qamdonense]|uniref:tape measure protein n=1 Tax=Pararhizobium qamdonense TaxID=3031126 RepID=UPI0023E0FB25|nr:tape measure protein [Pararhizobium qamdonense]